ncbi:MAG: 2-C-methyl-D-erythritol 2,4-cyclodiphosphate synthase [Coriobacteriales bacterium]
MRVGLGYDVHRLEEGRALIIGGVDIPYERGLLGHSDADVLSHAIGDAILGAARCGDLGKHFPPSDDRWKDADSLELLRQIVRIVGEAGFRIVDVDSVIIAQEPKMSPHREQMRANIAEALSVPVDAVGVKATTTEWLGFEGRGEGIAAQAVALLEELDK